MRLIARLNIGGPAIHTTLLTERLDPRRFESTLVTGVEGEDEGHMWDVMGRRDWEPIIIPSLGREISPQADISTLREVVRLMRQKQPHIVHTHTAKAGFVGRAAARLCRVPVVVHTFHGNVFKGYFSPRKTALFVRIERKMATWSDRVIVLGEAQKREILSLGIGSEAKMRVIPLGLDLAPFLEVDRMRGELRRELGVGEEVPIIGIVARLVPIKAIDLFLSAARQVLEAWPDALFVVAGDGTERTALEALMRELKIEKSVRFLGFRSDLARLNADFNCVVLCSHNEGLPVAVIEALASARAVVATQVGSVGDLVVPEESGLLVPPGDVEALAQAITRTINEPEAARKWGLNGRARVYPQLDISRLVRDIEGLYEEAAREKGIL